MKPVTTGVMLTMVVITAFFAVQHLAAEDGDGDRIVIYPGDYVVQSGDVESDGAWRDGVAPARVTILPGDVVVQKADVGTMGRWRIDVDPASGTATATPVSDRDLIQSRDFEETKAIEEVSPHLNVTLIDCEDCGGPITATGTRTIRIEGTFVPQPPATSAAVWSDPLVGWPSTPASSSNVVGVGVPGEFDPPAGPYTNGDPFGFRFGVDLDPLSTFSVYVDVIGDLSEP